MKDIETRADIDDLMNRFYAKAMTDEKIGYIFTDVAKLNLEHHLPIIGDFWETMLFGTGNYHKHGRNPMRVHGELNQKSGLSFEHFNRWLELFDETIDETFTGETSAYLKTRAHAIANRMLEYVSRAPAELF